jgi:phosphoserine phosphatase RsbU/P
MMQDDTGNSPDPGLFSTLRQDMRRGDFRRSVRRDFRELEEFMLDEERQRRLTGMGVIRRWFSRGWWLLKSMFLKLAPARRLLLALGLFLLIVDVQIDDRVRINFNTIGQLCVLFVLMLELKDKLIAQSELAAGQEVQKALMPEESPVVPGWDIWLFTRSANDVGGDLVDFLRVAEERFAIALGDVAGKGLRAALMMAKLQSTLKAIAADYSSVDALAAKVNKIFLHDGIRTIFASLLYVELHPHASSVTLVNAGHPPPVVLRESSIRRTQKGGPALGIMPNPVLTQQRVNLERGDMIVLYSDGLTEARNEKGEFFGEDRLEKLLPQLRFRTSADAGKALVAAVDSFKGEERAFDDLSIAIVKRL